MASQFISNRSIPSECAVKLFFYFFFEWKSENGSYHHSWPWVVKMFYIGYSFGQLVKQGSWVSLIPLLTSTSPLPFSWF
ncbi:hypothetical protein RchiOBHm_Chr6g0279011 [Rosa chinensis]|uniref:Uncharacterized protein n=1 Tax=Rosa chinensis TaxID=74649 RepID=A0A2P6PSX0_ROSCH|nr:hypothetical protein RchiOBHm_Chr6g0279011 [Rosa chinensis]